MLRKLKVALLVIGTAYPVALLGLMVVHQWMPQREGILALTQIFAPYLFVPLIVLVPIAFVKGATLLRVVLLVSVVVFGIRFMPRLIATPVEPTPGAFQLSALTWNVELGGNPNDIRDLLLGRQPDIAAFEEVDWRPLQRNEELLRLYPHQYIRPPHDTTSGMALLSKFPILEASVPQFDPAIWERPRMLQARLEVNGQALNVVVAHPSPAGRGCRFSLCYDSALRDARLQAIRAYVEPALQRGEALLLLGDFNTTEREPAYFDLSSGLQDSYKAVGVGTGNTWGPHWLRDRGLALLRIDYVFAGPRLRPLQAEVDCSLDSSDHCVLFTRFEFQ